MLYKQTSNGVTFKIKRNITLVVLGITVLLFVFFVISPLFNQIKEESGNLISQKNRLAELESKIINLKEFQKTYKFYQPNLEKINELFINSTEPIKFIEFLEREAAKSQLSLEISPLALQGLKEDLWPSMNFRLDLTGISPNFLKFLERLESGPYLIEVLNFNISKSTESQNKMIVSLLIKAYSQ